ncbi:5-hydroxytryptamine receptor 2B-like isoform X1 [Paramormyrops kingsleyae]|uniref:5-hydroxytryptamine receptor 2B n=1 Tax=Paramormyrops kingsleyae TaxID=1676925 RepID=A0A3B3RRI7_9TELE|nr:5-hydroxytryptamine receptor 2B-like isoform X1 [Paramormyrops kingsleyae]
MGYNDSSESGLGGEELCWPSLLTILFIIPTIGGNILVILAISLERKLQNATNYFLRSLAVADLLVGLLVMPIALIDMLYNYIWPLPTLLCPIWIFLDVLFSTASIMHMCAISLDRYTAIKRPIQHSQYKSRSRVMLKIAIVWLISGSISIYIPIDGLTNTNTTLSSNCTCELTKGDFIRYGSLVAFFIPLIIMMVTYVLTIRVLQKKVYLLRFTATQNFRRCSSPTVLQKGPATGFSADRVTMFEGPTSPVANKEMHFRRMSIRGWKCMLNLSNEQRASKVLGIVFLLFVVMWCPFFITNVISADVKEKLTTKLLRIFVWVGYVSSGINPLVYTLFNKTFRMAFSRYMTCDYSRMTTSVNNVRNGTGLVVLQGSLRLRRPTMQSSTTHLLDQSEVPQ